MAKIKVPSRSRLLEYETLKQSSGWYLAAWRDYRGLTLQDVADEANTSRGNVHDLETGRERSGGKPPARYNRDNAIAFAKALGTSVGHLIDTNPWNADMDALELFNGVSDADRAVVVRMVQTLKSKKSEQA